MSRRRSRGEHERGQHHVVDRVPNVDQVAVEQRVDRVGARYVGGGLVPGSSRPPPGTSRPVEEEVEDDQREPERGVERPASETTRSAWSVAVPPERRHVPSVTPTKAANARADASSAVAGTNCRSSTTGRLVRTTARGRRGAGASGRASTAPGAAFEPVVLLEGLDRSRDRRRPARRGSSPHALLGTSSVSTNATSVIPSMSSTKAPSRRRTKRRRLVDGPSRRRRAAGVVSGAGATVTGEGSRSRIRRAERITRRAPAGRDRSRATRAGWPTGAA